MQNALNLLPDLVATLLAEQGETPESIGIHPVEGRSGVSLRAVCEVQTNRKSGVRTVMVNHKNDARLAIEYELPAKHALQKLTLAFEREMTQFRIGATLREREHLLGLSALQPAFFAETQHWGEEQQRILGFFLPYRQQITGDLVLTGKCLSAAFGLPVTLELGPSRLLYSAGPTIGACILDANSPAGGLLRAQAPCVQVLVGPVPVAKLLDFVPGALQWRFLEEGLLHTLLPQGSDWEIHISVEPSHAAFRIAETDVPLCTGINTITF